MYKLSKPFDVFVLLLLVVTLVEAMLMQMLPLLPPGSSQMAALLECTLVAAVAAPLVWGLIVRPMMAVTLKEIDRTRGTLENVIDAVIHFDSRGTIESYNASASRLFGHSPNEIIGSSIESIIPRESGILDKPQGASLETVVHHKDGTPFPVEISISRLHTGCSSSFVAIIRDITERRTSEQALRESEKRYHSLFDNMLNGFAYCKMLFDAEGRPSDFVCLEVNRAFARHTGLNRVVGRKASQFVPELAQAHPELLELYGRVVRTGVPETLEMEYLPLGKWFFISVFTTEPGHFVTIFENITERRMAEREILKAKEDWERTFNAIVDPIMILDTSHRIVKTNTAMAAKLGEKACLLEKMLCCKCLHATDHPHRSCPHARLLEDGKAHNEEIYEPGLDAYFDVHVSPLFGPKGELQGSIHLARDITERKNLEKQLLHSQKMEALGTLAGGVAHDFNNILTAIIGYASLVKKVLPNDTPAFSHMQGLLFAADRATDLTRSLLAFSRKQKVELRDLELNEVVRNAQRMHRRLIRGDIEVKTTLAPEALHIRADLGQIEQVLMNLVTNAQHAMTGPGVLTVTTEAVELDAEFAMRHGFGKPGRYALLTYSDNGSGMDEATQQRIFEPFFTTKEAGKGTGLGLSIAYGIVKKHNGFITCHSEHGVGTSFRIFLPMNGSDSEKTLPGNDAPLPSGSETILVAEDDDHARSLISELLEEFGYRVVAASNGAEAVNLLTEHRDEVSLVVLDAIMPKLNGRDAHRVMMQIKPELRAVFTSGYPADSAVDAEGGNPAITSLAKPIRPKELLWAIRTLIDQDSAATA